MRNGDKDAEILVLRHQLSVLQRQLGPDRVRFTPGDRALLAALLCRLPRDVLEGLHLVVRPDTVLRWHRDLVARRHAQRGPGPCATQDAAGWAVAPGPGPPTRRRPGWRRPPGTL